MSEIALFPGSFDPFTIGHLSVVERSAPLFDRIIVAVGVNSSKSNSADVAERLSAISKAVRHLENVEVTSYSGLTVDACKNFGARYMLRGVRSVADFEYERNLADINRRIAGIETILLFSLPEHAAISSSVVRELDSFGYDTSSFIP
ncbi:MAG: pantetheine-phosphate adenylyltransferase [Muribaculaceae bacterium]|nr:pantetheine-phosphate adenylyltransferase [Muribaculaceae bacterium]